MAKQIKVAALNEDWAPLKGVDVEMMDLSTLLPVDVKRTSKAGVATFTSGITGIHFFRVRDRRVSTKVGGRTYTGLIRLQVIQNLGGMCYDYIVQADGLGTHTTVQSAVDDWDAASAPKSMFICSGTYDEAVDIPSSSYKLTIHAAGMDSVRVGGIGKPFRVGASDVWIRDLTLQSTTGSICFGQKSGTINMEVHCESVLFSHRFGGDHAGSSFTNCVWNEGWDFEGADTPQSVKIIGGVVNGSRDMDFGTCGVGGAGQWTVSGLNVSTSSQLILDKVVDSYFNIHFYTSGGQLDDQILFNGDTSSGIRLDCHFSAPAGQGQAVRVASGTTVRNVLLRGIFEYSASGAHADTRHIKVEGVAENWHIDCSFRVDGTGDYIEDDGGKSVSGVFVNSKFTLTPTTAEVNTTGASSGNALNSGVLTAGSDGTGPPSIAAPYDAQYLVLALHDYLTAERVLVAGSGLDLTDGGANGNATLDLGTLTGAWVPGSQDIGNYDYIAKTLQTHVGDGSYVLWLDGDDPTIHFDTGDYIQFDRSENELEFFIGTSLLARISASGLFVDTITELTGAAGVTIEGIKLLDSFLEFPEISKPSNPSDGYSRLYMRSTDHLYFLDTGGQEYNVSMPFLTVNKGVLGAISVSDGGGLNITWGAGVIYDQANEVLVATDAQGSPQACTANDTTYLYWVSGTGLTLSTTAPSGNNVPIAHITCDEDDIIAIHEEAVLAVATSQMRSGLGAVFKTIVADGLVVSEDTDVTNALDVSLSTGSFLHEDFAIHTVSSPILSRSVPLVRWYHVSGAWVTDTDAEINEDYYDDGTDLVEITGGDLAKYYKSAFYTDGTNIHWVYPNAGYVTVAQAIAAPVPTPPEALEHQVACTAVVMKGSDSAFPTAGGERWIDIRPRLGVANPGTVTDHGSLSGLGDDDHTQYLLADGSRPLSATWEPGSQDIGNYDFTAKPLDIYVGDGAFRLYLSTDPFIQFDANDYLQYVRASNYLSLFVGSTEYLRASAGGLYVDTITELVGAAGVTIEGTKLIDSYFLLAEVAKPANPDDGYGKLYMKNDDKIYWLATDGTESDLTAPAGAHGPGSHTEFDTWKVIYTDAAGDQQEIALGANATVLAGTSTSGAPVMEEIYVSHVAVFIPDDEDLDVDTFNPRAFCVGESGEHGTFTAIPRAKARAGTAGAGTNTILVEADDNPAFSSPTVLFTLALNANTEVEDTTLDNAWASGDIWIRARCTAVDATAPKNVVCFMFYKERAENF